MNDVDRSETTDYPPCPNCGGEAFAHGSVISTLRKIDCDQCGASTGWCDNETWMTQLWTAISAVEPVR